MSWMWLAALVAAAVVGMIIGILVMALLIAGNSASYPPSDTSHQDYSGGNRLDPDPTHERPKAQGEDGKI